MSLSIFNDYDALSNGCATRIVSFVKEKKHCVLCLAAGDTPRLAYQSVVKQAQEERVDFSACTFVGLDEWVGIPPENEGSCSHFLHYHLFRPLGIRQDQIHLFDAVAKDVEGECRTMDSVILKKGGIDLMLVGVGMNGHIGFNEPGVSPDLYSHVIALDETTRSVGQKYFRQTAQLQKGITLGFRHLMESETVIMMASGSKKAEIIRKALEGPITPDVPASMVRSHKDSIIMLDRNAADLLTIV